MKSTLVVLALALVATPALAGSHVEGITGSYTIPASEGKVTYPAIVKAKFGKVVIAEHEEGNCDMVSTDGDSSQCRTVTEKAEKVRVTVSYESEAGADARPEASGEASERGPVSFHFDFDPAKFDATTLAQIKNKKNARDMFALTSKVENQPVQVVDYEKSTWCSPEAMSDCENEVVYKTVTAPITTLTVELK